MRTSITSAAVFGLVMASSAVAQPFKFPLADGFPGNQNLASIQKLAHGTLSNAGTKVKPPPVSEQGLVNLRLVAFNEIFEAAFFSELLENVTRPAPGFEDLRGWDRQFVIDQLTATLAQEELHALNANNGLKGNGQQPIEPCQYDFPVENFEDAIALAAKFTSLVLGVLQDVNFIFAQNNDNGLVRGVSSTIGQEGEQEGFYRILQRKNLIPNELPFLTTGVRDFGFTAVQQFVVPHTCDAAIDLISKDLKTFIPLNVDTKDIELKDQDIEFSFPLNVPHADKYRNMHEDEQQLLWVQLINQQNLPIPSKLKHIHISHDKVTFTAWVPFESQLMNGLTIAAVTVGKDFTSAQDVAKNALIAPGLIIVN
ncbi:MAG: hypothetical protein M1820_000599 [Bogoriella megaspora]|nr:MAG: hypothetical protein M1820_000599 [Bogoriella megaspora]